MKNQKARGYCDDSSAVRLARKLRDQLRRQVLDPLNGFPLGRLKHDGLITPEEFEAATAWVALARLSCRTAAWDSLRGE